jgi:hypothetical protein
VGSPIPLARLEEIIDASHVAPAIEALLPAGVRHRQLQPRTLLIGMQLAAGDRRPAYLTEIHAALTSLTEHDQARLGVTAGWKTGPHQLTYRQVEHTFRLITRALSKTEPDGAPSAGLQRLCDQLTEASIPEAHKNGSTSLAVDWTDVEAWSRPVPAGKPGSGTDPEARWGHRNVNRKIQEGEMFFGFYLSAAVMTKDENGPAVPELARRITVASSSHDPAAALAGVLASMPARGVGSATSWPTPATPTGSPAPGQNPCGPPAPASCRTCTQTTADPAAPTTAPSSPTDACTAPPPPSHYWNWCRCRPAPPPPASPPTTRRPLSWPGTNSASTPPTTPTATAGMPAPPPPGRSAARCARRR